ncbi:MAG: septum formation initiator family protein [Clostridiales bacterium]|nr:septum formation initiator family protein [Clostridiales bacterium]
MIIETETKKPLIKKFFSKKNKVVTLITTICLLALFAFFGTSIVNQNADINRLENQKAEIEAKYEAQEEENEELQAVLDSEDMDDYIEQKAREKGYVKSNETVFYDISSGE